MTEDEKPMEALEDTAPVEEVQEEAGQENEEQVDAGQVDEGQVDVVPEERTDPAFKTGSGARSRPSEVMPAIDAGDPMALGHALDDIAAGRTKVRFG